jgi:hypothetical protein
MKNLYINDDAKISANSHISGEFAKRLYSRHNLRIINSYVKTGNLLEIGAGSGYFLDESRKLGFNSYGIELNPIQSDFIRNILKIPCEDSLISLSLNKKIKFDIVYHCDVISHFYDPILEFKKMNEIMNEGAFLIFETGNGGDINEKYLKYFPSFQYPDHLFFFSMGNLQDLCERTGFKVLKIYRYSILPELIQRNLLKLLYSVFPNKVKQKLPPSNRQEYNPEISSRNSKNMTLIKKMFNYWTYVLRYKVGYIAPKNARPQTVIVIAQKKKRV